MVEWQEDQNDSTSASSGAVVLLVSSGWPDADNPWLWLVKTAPWKAAEDKWIYEGKSGSAGTREQAM